MDNQGNTGARSDSAEKPIPFDNGPSAPAPAKENPAGGAAPVSHAPLSLGGSGTGAPVAVTAPAGPAAPPAAPKPVAKAAAPATPGIPVRKPVTSGPVVPGRISNCRTFFTKLHPGAIHFLDDQISAWLKENPGIVIKHTNAVTGEIVEKKTEPSILITVWW